MFALDIQSRCFFLTLIALVVVSWPCPAGSACAAEAADEAASSSAAADASPKSNGTAEEKPERAKPRKAVENTTTPSATPTPPSEKPATTTPATETPATETPATETPATETPATETPATETPPSPTGPASPATPTAKPADAPVANGKPVATSQPEPRLRFNFRFMRWVDVLEWFAEKADLSLVLDAPPSGTFNYSDTREYTPVEAIDLLNGVLLTKGYTLIRRERMLLVVDLKDGVPDGMVPRVELDELEGRGKFELVSMLFPLGRRPAATVQTEIKPLLGPYGKIVPLPATGQILVTDTAGIMRAIGVVIESITEPPAPPPAPDPSPPVLAEYSIKPADPKVALEVLGSLVPAAKLVYDEKADQLHVHAAPSQQTLVKGVLEQMQAGNQPEAPLELETYPISGEGATEILATLQTMLPRARLTVNPANGVLAAWCSAAEHRTIKEAVEKLQGTGSPERTRQLEVHRLSSGMDPDKIMGLLQTILPDARLSADYNSRMLVAVAVPGDQQVIRETLERFRPDRIREQEAPEAQFYELAHALPVTVVAAVKKSVPGALVAMEARGNRLMAVATEYEQKKIKLIVNQLEKAAFVQGQSKLIVYPVTLPQRKRFEAVLDTLKSELGNIRVIVDAEPGELSVWARPRQHEMLTEILGELKREVPAEEKFKLVAYPVESANPAAIFAALQEIFPDTKLVLDDDGGRILAWTFDTQHQAVKDALGQLLPQAAEPGTRVLRAYPFPYSIDQPAPPTLGSSSAYGYRSGSSSSSRYRPSTPPPSTSSGKKAPDNLLGALRELVPQAELTFDAKNELLIAVATPEDHDVIKTTLEQLKAEIPSQQPRQLEVYDVGDTDTAKLIPLLQSLVPDVQLMADPNSNGLLAWGTAEEQAALKNALEKLDVEELDDERPVLQVYPLPYSAEHPLAAGLNTSLQELLPKAKFTVDSQGKRLIVVASPADQEVIKTTLQQIAADPVPEEKLRLVTYQIRAADPDSVVNLMETLLPDVRFVLDKKTRRLSVWGTEEEHQAIKDAVEQMDAGDVPENTEKFMVHPISDADPTVAVGILQELLPEVKLQVDSTASTIVAWAREKDHETIKRVVEEMQIGESPDKRPQLEVYQINPTDAEQQLTTYQTVAPKAELSLDAKAGKLVAWATPKEHEALKAAVEKLGAGGALDQSQQVEVYPLTQADPETTLELLTSLVPDARLSVDRQSGNLIAVATLAEQSTIRGTLGQLQPTAAAENAPVLRIYPFPYSATQPSPAGVSVPVPPVPPSNALYRKSWRRPNLSSATRSTSTYPPAPEPATSGATSKPSLLTVLQQLVPRAQFTLDVENRRLLVVATPSDHEIIEATLKQVEQSIAAPAQSELAVYDVESSDPEGLLAVMQSLFPTMQFVLNAKTKRMAVRANPEEQAAIKSAFEKLDAGDDSSLQEKFTAYPVRDLDAEMAIEMLQELLPDVRFGHDTTADTIIARGRTSDHKIIEQTLEQMQAEPADDDKPHLVVYSAGAGDAYSMRYLLRELAPEAHIVADTEANRLAVLATAEDHQTVKAAVEQMGKNEPDESDPSVAVYTLESDDERANYYAYRMLRYAVPKALFTPTPDGDRLIVWARPDDHKTIKALVDKVNEEGMEKSDPTVAVYKLKYADVKVVENVVRDAVPEAELTDDDDTNSLTAWARPEDHAIIKEIVTTMDVEPPEGEKPTAVIYTLKLGKSSYSSYYTIRLLRDAAPGASFTSGSDPSQLMVWATPEEHETIKGIIDQLDAEESPETAPTLEVYTLKSRSAAEVTDVLEMVVPKADVADDADPQKLIVWARPDEHTKIQGIIDKIDAGEPGEAGLTVAVYTLKSTTAATALPVLQAAFPEAVLSAGDDPHQLIAWGRAADHTAIKQAVEDLSAQENTAEATVYTLKSATAENAILFLQTAVPEANFSMGDDSGQIIAWATPSDHELIKGIVAKIDLGDSPESAPKVVIYSLKYAEVDQVSDVLRDAVPDVQLTDDEAASKLIAWARPEDHKIIQEIITTMDVETPAGEQPTAVIYTLKLGKSQYSSYYTVRLLREAAPGATFTSGSDPSQLMVWARPKEHETIKGILDKLSGAGSPETAPKIVVYTLKHVAVGLVENVVQDAVPDAELTEDDDTNALAAWARPDDHAIIQEIVQTMDVEPSADKQPTAMVYTLKTGGSRTAAYYMIRLLSDAVPKASFTMGADPSQLVAWALPEDHEMIQGIVEKLTGEGSPETTPTLQVYTLKSRTAADAIEVLQMAVPEAQLAPDADPQKLIAWARPPDQSVIKSVVEKIDVEDSPESAATAVVYTLELGSTSSVYYAIRLLREAAPGATFTLGSDSSQLIAWARPKEHEIIEVLVEKLSGDGPPETTPTLEVYVLKSRTAAEVIEVLGMAVPDAELAADADPQKLIAWARPKDQVKIKDIVEKVDVEETAAGALTVAVYTLKSSTAATALPVLQAAFPEVVLSAGDDPRQLIAWGRPADHAELAKAVEGLSATETTREATVYTLKSATAENAILFLQTAVPEASFSAGDDPGQVIAWATPTDHEVIKGIVAKIDIEQPPESAPVAAVYTLPSKDIRSIIYVVRVLRTAAPRAEFTLGSDASQLVTWASPDDHKVIEDLIEKISQKPPPETAPRAVVYTLQATTAESAIAFLASAVPTAEFAAGSDPRQLIAWATPEDHEIIKTTVEQMSSKEADATAPKVEVYPLESTDAADAVSVLQAAVPHAVFTASTDGRQLIAWARPDEHAVIKAAVQNMSQKEPPETAPKVVTYRLETSGAAGAAEVLAAALPDVQFTVGADPDQLIAYARPGDHEVIKAAVEQIEADSLLDAKRVLAVYPIKSEDSASLMEVLDESLTKNAKFVTDAKRDSLIVWADAKHQEAIKSVVDQFLKELPEPVEPASRVYRLQKADLTAASSVLEVLVPNATIALDDVNHSLVVSAMPEDHDKIKTAVDEMDRVDAERDPQLKVHPVTAANAADLLPVLQGLFIDHPGVQVSLDEKNDALIAIATPAEHKMIGELIEKVEESVLAGADATLQLYSLKNVDSYALMQILATLLDKQGIKAELSIDTMSNQLVAITRPEHQAEISKIVEQLRTEERTLEIFRLDFVEPSTAQMAIATMFRDERFNAPDVDADEESGQLFVRGSKEQLVRVRQVLIKLGETSLGSLQLGSGNRLRVIPFQGDAKAVVEEIRRVWPQLRQNPIQVVTPPDEDSEDSAGETSPKSEQSPAKPPAAEGAEDKEGAEGDTGEEGTPSAPGAADADPAVAAEAAEQEDPEAFPPVVVMLSDDNITIACEDPEALDQFESLLQTLVSRGSYADRHYSIFTIRHTSATEIAGTLRELFRSSSSATAGWSRWQQGARPTSAGSQSRVVIVPDERLNTILVQGSRSDRARIESLLKILDTDEVPPTPAARKPKVIPIENAEVSRIEQVVLQAFQSRLGSSRPGPSSGGSRTASGTGLMRAMVTADKLTNSLIVVAPVPLIDDITEFVALLDESMGESPARGIKLILLKKASADRVREALDAITKGRTLGPRPMSATSR